MKTLLVFNDTETTGITKKAHKRYSVYHKEQILSYAVVICEKDPTPLFEKEVKIKMKDNVVPHPSALLVNNINPFSKEWDKEALSEFDGAQFLFNTIKGYKEQGYKIVFIAYNAEYDESLFSDMLTRCGINFHGLFDAIFDPLPMARQMVKDGLIKTVEKQGFGGKTWQSSSLEDVYNGLGFSSKDLTAHNALVDTRMLKDVVFKLYYLFAEKDLEEIDSDMTGLAIGDVREFIVHEDHELIKRSGKILKMEEKSVTILSHDHIKEAKGSIKASLVKIPLTQIFDINESPVNKLKFVNDYYNQYSDAILPEVDKVKNTVVEVSPVLEDFSEVKKVMEKKLKGESVEDSTLLSYAEDLSYAMNNKGWSVLEKGKNYENDPVTLKVTEEIQVILNPVGEFSLVKDGKTVLTSEKKTEILAKVKELGVEAGTPAYKELNSNMGTIKDLTSVKHPKDIINEFNQKKTEVFNGANMLHKETLKGLKEFLYRNNPDAYKDLSLPDFKLNLSAFMKKK